MEARAGQPVRLPNQGPGIGVQGISIGVVGGKVDGVVLIGGGEEDRAERLVLPGQGPLVGVVIGIDGIHVPVPVSGIDNVVNHEGISLKAGLSFERPQPLAGQDVYDMQFPIEPADIGHAVVDGG